MHMKTTRFDEFDPEDRENRLLNLINKLKQNHCQGLLLYETQLFLFLTMVTRDIHL